MDLIVSSYTKNYFLSAVSPALVEEVYTSKSVSDASQTTSGSSLSDRTTVHLGGYLPLLLYHCPIVIQQPAMQFKSHVNWPFECRLCSSNTLSE